MSPIVLNGIHVCDCVCVFVCIWILARVCMSVCVFDLYVDIIVYLANRVGMYI